MSNDLYLHLYRRAGFGADANDLKIAQELGWAGTVRRLVKGLTETDLGSASIPDPQFATFTQEGASTAGTLRATEFLQLTNWWIDRMLATTTPFKEKLTLLLHSQFPTAYYKVDRPSLLYRQNQIFRTIGAGSFTDLTIAVAKDPAMLIWLDTDSDVALHPNENFAREVMERFALGVGHYTENDVKAAARCFTGWSLNFGNGEYYDNITLHDSGIKTLLGRTGYLTGEQAIEIITREDTSARWVISRLFSWLAYPVGPRGREVADLMHAYVGHRNIGTLLEAILKHPAFVSPKSVNGLVKQPVEYVVGTLRYLKLSPANFPSGYIMNVLTQLGQQLFNPPTVGGWGFNDYWLSTATALEQLNFANTVSSVANLAAVEAQPLKYRPREVAKLLGVTAWSANTEKSLSLVSNEPNKLLALALVSPEYLVN